jgi:hypothetical protein
MSFPPNIQRYFDQKVFKRKFRWIAEFYAGDKLLQDPQFVKVSTRPAV